MVVAVVEVAGFDRAAIEVDGDIVADGAHGVQVHEDAPLVVAALAEHCRGAQAVEAQEALARDPDADVRRSSLEASRRSSPAAPRRSSPFTCLALPSGRRATGAN